MTGALPFNKIRSTIAFGESTGYDTAYDPDCRSSTSLLDCVDSEVSNKDYNFFYYFHCRRYQVNFGVRCDGMYITSNTSHVLLIQIFHLLVVKKVILD